MVQRTQSKGMKNILVDMLHKLITFIHFLNFPEEDFLHYNLSIPRTAR